MLQDIDGTMLLKYMIPEADTVCLFSKEKKKHASFVMDYNQVKLKETMDRLKVKLNPDYQCCIFSIKNDKNHNKKDNLFRSKVYAWLDIDYKECTDATEEKIYNLEPTPSIILRTTGGFHVLWVGEEPVQYDRNMDDFYRSVRTHVGYQGILADGQGDPNKFVRIAGNLGSDNRTVIKGIYTDEMYKNFTDFRELIPEATKERELMSKGMGTVGRNYMVFEDLMEMSEECPQMKHFSETGGVTREEWIKFMMIYAFAASRDVPKKDMIFSKFLESAAKHPKYNGSENNTQFHDIYRRYESGQYDAIPLCDSLKEMTGIPCSESCAQIPYKTMVGKCSFLRFKMPDGFVEKNGKIYRIFKNDVELEVINEALKPLYSVQDDVDGFHWLKLQGNRRIVTMEESLIPRIKEVLSLLSSYHIVCGSEKDAGVYLKHCQKQARLMHGTQKMGVHDGNVILANDYDTYPIFAESTDPFFRNYTGKYGDQATYSDMIQYLMKKHALFALAYSVALIQMLPFRLHANPIIRMYGRAGIGKTLLLRYAKSTIGNPNLFPIQRNITPLMMIKTASRVSFLAMDELIGGGFNFEQVINALFAIQAGNKRLSYHETTEGGYYTTVLATGESRFTMNKARDTGPHRRVYELYANVDPQLRDDMVTYIHTLGANYGFARALKESVYDRVDKIKKAHTDVKEMMPKYDYNINHRDMIALFNYVIAIAHATSGISLEELCTVASSVHTFEGVGGSVGLDELTDYCTNAYMVIRSLYNEYYDKRKVLITQTDLEVELKKHDLDYYPEVMEFIKNIWGWGQAHTSNEGRRTTRTGVVVKSIYPPLIWFIMYMLNPENNEFKSQCMRGMDVTERTIESMRKKDYQFNLLINVLCDLRSKEGVEKMPEESWGSFGVLKAEITRKETGLGIAPEQPKKKERTPEQKTLFQDGFVPEEEERWESGI